MTSFPPQLQTRNALAWITENQICNENGYPLEWKNHRFLIEPMSDMSPIQATIKCSQIGWSTLAILKTIHLARFWGANVIYTLPTRTITKDFVVPKVDKIISRNKAIQEIIGETNSINLKSVGDRFIYFRGTYEEGEAIAISANVLIRDEFDRSSQNVLELYETRLGDAKRERPDLGFIWSFSNPSTPGFGVHDLYQQSDQKIWMVKCAYCGRWQELTWPQSVNLKKERYECWFCHNEIHDHSRKMGKWVAQYPERTISGYHISKLIVPWITAKEMITASEGDTAIFYNFWLGLPWVDPDVQVTRESIIKAIVLTQNPNTHVVIGVDNGIEKHYVIGNKYGIFDYGVTKDWTDIENLHKQYDAITVIDALPHPTYPQQLVKKYPNRVFTHWFSPDTKSMGICRFGEGEERGRVIVDRTRMLDLVADRINRQKITFNMPTHQLEPYISHWEAIYRIIEEDANGQPKPKWITQSSKADHWAFATELWAVGMEKANISNLPTGAIKTKRQEKFPTSFATQKYGFEGEVGTFSPGYDMVKLKQRLSRPKKKKATDIFRAIKQ